MSKIGPSNSAIRAFLAAALLLLLQREVFALPETLGSRRRGEDGHVVLLLNSYHSTFPWTAELTEGIRQTLLSAGDTIEIIVEYMDAKRGYSADSLIAFSEYIEKKYAGRKIDLIVCSDDDALAFARRMSRRLFGGVPVVFCGVNTTDLYDPGNYPQVTGLFENLDILGTAELALRLFPRTRTLALVSDFSTTGMTVISQARRELAPLADVVNIVDLFALPEQELQEALSALPPETVVLMLVYFEDKEGGFIPPSRSVSLVRNACAFPLFGLWDILPEAGALGGSVLLARRHGEKAAEVALRILLEGVSPSEIEAEFDPDRVPVFDYSELRRFNISRRDLPADAIIVNEPRPVARYDRRILLAHAAVVFALALYVLILLINERRRKVAAEALALRKAMWEGLFGNAPDGFVVFDANNTVLNANERFSSLFGYTLEEVIGRNIDSLVANRPGMDAEAQEISKRVLAGEMVYREAVRRRKDGDLVHVGIHGVLFPMADGSVLGYGIYSDISERRRKEEEMARHLLSESRISSIAASLLTKSAAKGIPAALEETGSFTGAKEGFLVDFSPEGGIERELLFADGKAAWSTSPHLSDVFDTNEPGALFEYLWEKGRLLLSGRVPGTLGGLKCLQELKRLFGEPLLILPIYSERSVSGWLGLRLPSLPLSSSLESFLGMFCDLAGGVLLQEKRRATAAERARILDGTSRGIVEILGRTLAMKDPYTVGHQFEVARLARSMAERGRCDEAFIERVYHAALVHDLGKIVIPSSILSKPGKLNAVEFEIIKNHALHGWEILSSTDFPWPLADIVVQHHERLDGSGYPYGLKGDAIRMEARFIAVADVVEAMTSDRPYRPGLGIERALEEIRSRSEVWFDPRAVELCLAVIEEGFVFDEKSYAVGLL